MIVFDTNILSTFAKIQRLELLHKLFVKQQLVMIATVKKEIRASHQDYAKNILQDTLFKEQILTQEEKLFASTLPKTLGLAERECISVCKHRKFVFITNDFHAVKCAEINEVVVLDLLTVLISLHKFQILTKTKVKEMVTLIEKAENTVIKGKGLL